MKRVAIALSLGIAALCLSNRAMAQGAVVQASPILPRADSARAASGTAAAIARGDATIVAWAQQSATRQRVFATANASTIVALGPSGLGGDGAPAATAPGDGSVWIAASRNHGAGQRLWVQRWENGTWQDPITGPSARPYDHHPALASDPASRRLWATWIGEDGFDRNATMLYASQWTGRGWSAAEPLPRTVGVPMAPAIAVDASGTPFVAWAASDGTDAEIWVSARRGDRWSTPVAVSRNQVPDITPSIAVTARGLLVTWISYTAGGYVPVAVNGSANDAWGDPTIIDESPGGSPQAASINGVPAIFWRRLGDGLGGSTITSRVLQADGWSAATEVAAASGSPFRITSGPDGRLLMAFSQSDGRLGVAETDAVGGRDEQATLAALAARATATTSAMATAAVTATTTSAPSAPASAAATTAPPTRAAAAEGDPVVIIPESYTAFGDSITNGVVYDPDRSDSPGYRAPLQQSLRSFFGRGSVFNAGVDGETTADGLGRVDNAIIAQDSAVILIMEGSNDIISAIEVDVIAFNLRSMVQRAYVERPGILPFLAQLPPRLDPGPDGFDGPGNSRIDELNALLPEIGEEEGAGVVDMNTPLDGHPELMSNPLHPSEAGYEVMAEQWYDTVRPAVAGLTNRGDIDASGRTDGLDLVHLALAFGALVGEPRYRLEADINGDGIVDGFDLDLLIEFFGQDSLPSGGGGGGT